MNNSKILSSSVCLQLKKDKTLQLISQKPEKKIWDYAKSVQNDNWVALGLPILTLFRMGFFGAAHGWGEPKSHPPSLISVTHILQWWNLAQLYLTQTRSKKYMNHVRHPLNSADICIFSPEISKFCYIKKYRYRLYFDA